jgi:spore germination protein YaaH
MSLKRTRNLVLTASVIAALIVPSAPAAARSGAPLKPELTYPRIMHEASKLAAAPAPQSLYGAYQSAPTQRIALAPTKSPLQREVFGFVNAGNLTSPSVGWTTWNLSLLSTVAYFALQVNSGDGNLVTNNTGWSVYHSQAMLDFVNAAHAAGTRVVVSINLHDMSTSPTNQVCAGLIAANAKRTIDQSVFQVAAAGIDGININYEATNTTCANGLTSRAQMTDFTKNLRAAMPAGKYLAIDTYSGSAEDNLEFFDITGLAPYVDSFFVMAYDMDYDNAVSPPLSCTAYCFNPTSPLNTYRFNTTLSVQQYKALVPASKIVLGQPYYGRKGCVAMPNGPAHQYQIPGQAFGTPTYQYTSTT